MTESVPECNKARKETEKSQLLKGVELPSSSSAQSSLHDLNTDASTEVPQPSFFTRVFSGVVPTPVRLVYFLLSLAQEYPVTAITWIITNELGLTPVQMTAYYTMTYTPWLLKPVYGFVSDQFPICGYRRKPYVILMAFLSACVFISFGLCGNNFTIFQSLGVANALFICFSEVMVDGITVELGNMLHNRQEYLHRIKEKLQQKGSKIVSLNSSTTDGDVSLEGLSSTDEKLLNSASPRALIQSESMAVRSLASVCAAALAVVSHVFLSPRIVVMSAAVWCVLTIIAAFSVPEQPAPRISQFFVDSTTSDSDNERINRGLAPENDSSDEETDTTSLRSRQTPNAGLPSSEKVFSSIIPSTNSEIYDAAPINFHDSNATFAPLATSSPSTSTSNLFNTKPVSRRKKSCCHYLWKAIKRRTKAIFYALLILIRPALFVFLTHVTPSSTDPYYNYLYSVYVFPPWLLSSFNFISLTGSLLGSLLYWKLFSKLSIRKVFVWATIVDIIAGLPVVALTAQWNRKIGIPDMVYIPIVSFIDSIFARVALMPSIVLASESCPPHLGLEATMFSVFTSVSNAGTLVSSAISIIIMQRFEIEQDHWDMLPPYMLICLCSQVLPLLSLPLLPTKDELMRLPDTNVQDILKEKEEDEE